MSQGLQLSILLTGSDIGLKADSALADAEATEQGLVFGEMLGDMVQPAKKGLGQAALRQLPAGISMLSGVSQAMLANSADAATEASAELSAETDISLLAASLLGQIALNDKASTDATDVTATVTEDSPLSADDAAQQPGQPDTAAVKASLVQRDITTTVAAQTVEQSKAKESSELKQTGQHNDKKQAVGADALKQQLQPVTAEMVEQATENAAGQTKLLPAQAQDAAVKAAKPAKAKLADGNSKNDNTSKISSAQNTIQQVGAEPAAKPAAELLAATDVNAQEYLTEVDAATASKLAQNGAESGNSDRQNTQPSSNVSVQDARLQPEELSSIHTNSQMVLSGADKVITDTADTKATSLTSQQATKTEKGLVTADTAAKNGSEQQSQQHSQRQNSANAAIDSALQLQTEASVVSAKVSTEAGATNRVETAFGSSLHAAELRQQSQVSHSSTKVVTEQLKQSLNLQHQDAAGQLRERVNLMVRQNIQVAEIRLDPAGLGQMQIKIDMQQEQASVQFVVQQSQAKELVEQQLPRLRELLQQQGIVLGEGSVQQQSQQQERQLAQRQNDGEGGAGSGSQGNDQADTGEPAATVQVVSRLSERLVDYYA